MGTWTFRHVWQLRLMLSADTRPEDSRSEDARTEKSITKDSRMGPETPVRTSSQILHATRLKEVRLKNHVHRGLWDKFRNHEVSGPSRTIVLA